MDLHGDVELVESNDEQSNAVQMNDGTGHVERADFADEQADTYGLAVGDLNGDGYPDIVFANSGSANGVVLGRHGGD